MPVPGSKEPAQIALLNENCVTLSNHDHTTGKALAVGRMRSGLAANRPAAGSAGNVYFSTDTGVFNADTGTAWVQFLTSGGQATVTGWTLVDPIVRDILSFGAKPTGTVDATITRTGAGALRADTNLGVGVAPAAWAATHRVIQVGQTGSLNAAAAAQGVNLQDNTVWDGTSSKALVTGGASSLNLSGGAVSVVTAPSAAAGAVQTFTTRLTLDQPGNLGVGVAPGAWASSFKAVQVAGGAALWGSVAAAGMWLTSNTIFNGTNRVAYQGGVASAEVTLGSSPALTVVTYPAVGAGATQTGTTRLAVAPTGTLTLTPDAGQPHIASPGALILQAADFVTLRSFGTDRVSMYNQQFYPLADNAVILGDPTHRWQTVYAVVGSINTSHVSMKRDFASLDPAACVAAVEETDWLSFTYNPPNPPERADGVDDTAWSAQQESYQQMLADTMPARRSKGYVLGSEEYRTADLFGTIDRKSGQATADLAVVACALQDALRRLAALEGQSGPSGQQPAS
jgi:hypothetical protein